MPWMITWFAHQLSRFQDVARLYDVFLVSHPLFCLYVSAAVSGFPCQLIRKSFIVTVDERMPRIFLQLGCFRVSPASAQMRK